MLIKPIGTWPSWASFDFLRSCAFFLDPNTETQFV